MSVEHAEGPPGEGTSISFEVKHEDLESYRHRVRSSRCRGHTSAQLNSFTPACLSTALPTARLMQYTVDQDADILPIISSCLASVSRGALTEADAGYMVEQFQGAFPFAVYTVTERIHGSNRP